jgi:hypothetical protein
VVLEKRPDNRLPSVARAATSPTAIVLAGAGIAVGEAAHLGLAIALVLGAAGYGARVAWSAVRRRVALQRRGRRHLARIDPWSVPEPWRGYVTRALDARKALRQLARDFPPGPVADYLSHALDQVESAVEEYWALARSGAALAGPPGRSQRVAQELGSAQAGAAATQGADRAALESGEDALASELRSLRHLDSVATQVSAQLATLSARLEGVVAAAGELMVSAGVPGADLSDVSSQLTSLTRSLEEARRILPPAPPAPGDAPG